MICGSTQHWARECPDRSKYPPKGKGKGMGSVNYALAFMISAASYSAVKGRPELVVLDSGATETVGGIESVEDFIGAVRQQITDPVAITVCRKDRPWFKFGNGEWGQACSRVDIAFSEVVFSVYTLEAPGVPILLSQKALMAMTVVLDFGNATAKFTKVPALGEINLVRAGTGHILIDLVSVMGGLTRGPEATRVEQLSLADGQSSSSGGRRGLQG